MGDGTFYVTTPIYYPNDVPHIGHAYTSVAVDFVARYHRLRGENVFFLTGTDEHGQKLQQSAEAEGKHPQAFVDAMEPRWREVWERLGISYDDYVRTTEPRHEKVVGEFLQRVHDNGRDDIYLGTYEGLYCVACEAYYIEEDLNAEGNCPIHDRPVEQLAQENYFFRLSAYADRLLEHYEANPDAVRPGVRRNEVLSLIRGGLQDFSISRTSFDWGVPLPWDPKHVCYVWFDALTNYLTGAGYGADPSRFERTWPADIHFTAKDILRFHAVYWPAMLMAAGMEPPRCVFSHGYLTVGGAKMSKTNATGIHPFDLTDHFGVDAYRYYFMREIQFGADGNFSWESMAERYKADLSDGLGNLASRVLAMLEKNFDGKVPDANDDAVAGALPLLTADVVARFDAAMDDVALTRALEIVWEIVAEANKYLVEKAPWTLVKEEGRLEEAAKVLYASAETLRILALLVSPIMPGAAARLWEQLGIPEPLGEQRLPGDALWGGLAPGTPTTKGDSLFPRLDEKED
jgi:methionyl-tRNA synthetase